MTTDLPERLSKFQRKVASAILNRGFNGALSTTEVACCAKSNRLAVSSALFSMKRKGMAGYFIHGNDQWAVRMWFLTQRGKSALKTSEGGVK